MVTSRRETMWATKYIGIDFSSKNIAIAFTSINENKLGIDYYYIQTKLKNFKERFEYLLKEFNYFLENAEVRVAYIEEPVIALRHKSVKMVNQVSGMLLALLIKYGIKFREIHNKTWKKEIVGNGNATKKDIMQYIKDKFRMYKISQDVADAICIYEFGVKEQWVIL